MTIMWKYIPMENRSSKALFFLRQSIRIKKPLEMLVMSGMNPPAQRLRAYGIDQKLISHDINNGHINDIIVGFRTFRHEY